MSSVNRPSDLMTSFIQVKSFSYMLSLIFCLGIVQLFGTSLIWRLIIAINLTGFIGTLLETIEYNLINDEKYLIFRILVIFSEILWIINETSPILISYLKLQAMYIVDENRRKLKYTILSVIVSLVLLRIWIIVTRILTNALWNDRVAQSHTAYFAMLGVSDLILAILYTHLIYTHFSGDIGARSGNVGLALKIASCIRILTINVMMCVLSVSFFVIDTYVGNFIFQLVCCFKYNISTIFLIDLILAKSQITR